MREWGVRTAKVPQDHKTGRFCSSPNCKKPLIDIIVSEGENMKPELIAKGKQKTGASDLMIAMGTSLDDPVYLPTNGKFVMITTRYSRFDDTASLLIR